MVWLCFLFLKFYENILNGFQVIERFSSYRADTIAWWMDRQMDRHSRQKQNVSTSISGDIILYMSMKFHENILTSLQVIEGTQNYHCQISKWNNSKNELIRNTVLVLCTLSDDALYFYDVSSNCLKQFSSYRADTESQFSNEGLSSYEVHTKWLLSNFKGE